MAIFRLLTFTLLVSVSTASLSDELLKKTSLHNSCPLGFTLFITNSSLILCYRQKPPESFNAYDKDCVGNLYTLEFASDFYGKNERDNLEVWTDYVRRYERGPLVKWSTSEGMGQLLNEVYQVKSGSGFHQSKDKEYMCSVFNTTTRTVRPASCFDKYVRLCVVRSYERLVEVNGCPTSFFRMSSPLAACVAPAAASHQKLPVTWERAQLRCSKLQNSSLLHVAYIYANHPDLQALGEQNSTFIPIGRGLQIDEGGIGVKSFKKGGQFKNLSVNHSMTALDVSNWSLSLIDRNSAMFYHILCERLITLSRLGMEVVNDESSGLLTLTVNSSNVSVEKIWCFTESKNIYPERVTMERLDSYRFTIKPVGDGYYWCINADTTNFLPEESNAVLYIGNESSIADIYAIKVYWNEGYTYSTINKVVDSLRKSLDNTFLLVRSKDQDCEKYCCTPMKHLRAKKTDTDGHTLILHLQFHPSCSPSLLEKYSRFRVLYMQPIYISQRNSTKTSLKTNTNNDCHLRYSFEGDSTKDLCYKKSVTNSLNTELNKKVLNDETPDDQIRGKRDGSFQFPDIPPPKYPDTPMDEDSQETDYTEARTSTTKIPDKTLTPEEHIENVILNMNQALENLPDVTSVHTSAKQVSDVLKLDSSIAIPSDVLHLLDQLGSQMVIGENREAILVTPQVAVAVADNSEPTKVLGMQVLSSDNAKELTNGSVKFIHNKTSAMNMSISDLEVKLPTSLQGKGRVSFVVFYNGRAFNADTTTRTNSIVVSVSLVNDTTLQEGEFIELFFRRNAIPLDNETMTCGYWDFNAFTVSGASNISAWSTNGCEFHPARNSSSLDLCKCNHLTHFGILIMSSNGDEDLGKANEIALSIISIVGCCFSLVGLTVIALTGALFKSWRKKFCNKIWLHLTASTTLLFISFSIISLKGFSGEPSKFCIVIGVILHYSVLSSFSWMVVAAAIAYERLVVVLNNRNHSHRLMKACILCWGLPCIVVGTLLAVDAKTYEFKNSDVNKYCYPRSYGYWLTVFLPVLITLIVNTILFFLIICSVFIRHSNIRSTRKDDVVQCITTSFLLANLFGLPWVIGMIPKLTFTAYIFCVTASFQGFILFLNFIVFNKQTTNLWLNYLKIKQKRSLTAPTSYSTRLNDFKEKDPLSQKNNM